MDETGLEIQTGNFIPVARTDLIESLLKFDSLQGDEAEQFRRFAKLLARSQSFEIEQLRRELIDAYDPFDPDTLLVDIHHPGELSDSEREKVFYDRMGVLLQKANFRQLSQDEIEEALDASKLLGVRLKVDFSAFETLTIYARGVKETDWKKRVWYRWYQPVFLKVPVHRRLVVLFRYRANVEVDGEPAPRAIFLKIFKNIPKSEVDLLLPGAKIRFSLWDRGSIILPTLSGIGITLFKLFQAFVVSSLLISFWNLLGFITLVVGTIGYGVRSLYGFLNTRNKYQLHLTRHLYYQNLGNNIGVILRLLYEGEEQEFREALICYFVLSRRHGGATKTLDEIKQQSEMIMTVLLADRFTFDVQDAIDKLVRLGLVVYCGDGKWRAVSLHGGMKELEARIQSQLL